MRLLTLTIISSFFLLNMKAQEENKLTIDPFTFTFQTGQTVEGEIGTFHVPENRVDKSSRQLSLRFLRFKALANTSATPVVLLADEIEEGSIGNLSRSDPNLLQELRERGDVIVFDRRGTGRSSLLPNCSGKADFTMKKPMSKKDYLDEVRSAAQKNLQCLTDAGVDLNGYNLTEFVRDIESLRHLLGIKKISFVAKGFGSKEALEYAGQYPENVDRIVLINGEGPGQALKMPKHINKYINRLSRHVERDTLAQEVYPDLDNLMRAVFYELVQEPVKVRIKTRLENHSEVIGISKFDVQLATSTILINDPDFARRLPFLFHQMKKGNYDEMAEFVYLTRNYYRSIHPMKLLVRVAEGISAERQQLMQKQMAGAILGDAPNFPFPDLGLPFGMEEGKEEIEEPIEVKVPVLIFTGTLDAHTALERGIELDSRLPDAEQVVVDGAGHDLLGSTPLVKQMLVDFISGEEVLGQVILLPRMSFDLK